MPRRPLLLALLAATAGWSGPAVRAKLQERCGRRIPLQEPVTSPAAMSASSLLRTVAEA